MLTRSRSRRGEGTVEEGDPEMGKRRTVHKSTMSELDAGEHTETKMCKEQFQ